MLFTVLFIDGFTIGKNLDIDKLLFERLCYGVLGDVHVIYFIESNIGIPIATMSVERNVTLCGDILFFQAISRLRYSET